MLSELRTRKLTKLFAMYDAQNQGVLRFSDFERIVHKLAGLRGWKPGEEKYERLNNKYAFRWITMQAEIKQKANKNMDYKIHIDEWLRYHELAFQNETYQQEVTSIAELIFDIIDLDESGNLDRQEWMVLFQVFNIPVVYLDETFDKIDRDHDGSISKEEFLPLLEEFYYSDDPNAAGNGIFGPI
jgi:Ca2+-binding EF-hand superfamily protein